jgi:hypothetical protein
MHITSTSPPHLPEGRKDAALLSGLRIGDPPARLKSNSNNNININGDGMHRHHTLSGSSHPWDHGHGHGLLSKARKWKPETLKVHAQSIDIDTDTMHENLTSIKQPQRLHAHGMDSLTDTHHVQAHRGKQPSPETHRVYDARSIYGMENVADEMCAHMSSNKKYSHGNTSGNYYANTSGNYYINTSGIHSIASTSCSDTSGHYRDQAYGKEAVSHAVQGRVRSNARYFCDTERVKARSMDNITDGTYVPAHRTQSGEVCFVEAMQMTGNNKTGRAMQSAHAGGMSSVADDIYTPVQYAQIEKYLRDGILTRKEECITVRPSNDLYIENGAMNRGMKGTQTQTQTQTQAQAQTDAGANGFSRAKSQLGESRRVKWTHA